MPKLLVANRGEIAIRIFKTAKKKGWTCVAVYSEADQNSLHLDFADEVYALGPGPASQTYLHIEKVIDIAIHAKVDFIHPGYGFLSESAAFAEAVEKTGIVFVGPSANAMRHLGDKISAKQTAAELGIPMVRGIIAGINGIEEALEQADTIGYPVMVKAAAGGGGKGMRVIHNAEDLSDSLDRAKAEAQASFGNDIIFLEQYIHSPRHIEIQIIGDQQGNVLFLPERECSLQRRHQKLMEESPANFLPDTLRQSMSQDAVNLAKSCGYYSTGTVEFMVDQKGNYFFLEMNTRLQVEHTVSEMVTGLDLVDMQLEVASRMPLHIKQEDIHVSGHAIQWRINAEDPLQNFAPSSGHITHFTTPVQAHVRIDSGYEQNKNVPVLYDPLIAKLICWGVDRPDAIQRLKGALNAFDIEGISTSIPFGLQLLDHPDIVAGHYGVNFLELHLEEILKGKQQENHLKAAAALALHLYLEELKNLSIPHNI
ncbi:MAG: ATP-grasp domain-containing protein [Saprospiraceae bacterium]|nr:ATP-grasp domain-containing protein [Saprospiraceae bacterium]